MYIMASSFGLIFCHATSSYEIPAEHKIFIIFFQYPDHLQSQIEDGYRKEITFLFSHLQIHCLYSCGGSLVFTVIG